MKMGIRKADFNQHREFIGKMSQVTNVKKKNKAFRRAVKGS